MSDDRHDPVDSPDPAPAEGGGQAAPEGGARPAPEGTVDRRDLFKGLAGLPLLGAFGAAAWADKRINDEKRREILKELGVSGEAPAIIDRARSQPPSDRINLGIIGIGGEGEALLRGAGFASVERHVLPHDPMNVWFVSRKG